MVLYNVDLDVYGTVEQAFRCHPPRRHPLGTRCLRRLRARQEITGRSACYAAPTSRHRHPTTPVMSSVLVECQWRPLALPSATAAATDLSQYAQRRSTLCLPT